MPGLCDVLESLEEMSNKKNNIAAYDSKMIEKYNLTVKRELGAAHAKFVLTQFISHPALRDENLKGFTVAARACFMVQI
jgi:hypothetical protein